MQTLAYLRSFLFLSFAAVRWVLKKNPTTAEV